MSKPDPLAAIAEHMAERLHATDAILERVYGIADALRGMEGKHIHAQRARRAGRRICNLIDQVDETLGLDGEDNA